MTLIMWFYFYLTQICTIKANWFLNTYCKWWSVYFFNLTRFYYDNFTHIYADYYLFSRILYYIRRKIKLLFKISSGRKMLAWNQLNSKIAWSFPNFYSSQELLGQSNFYLCRRQNLQIMKTLCSWNIFSCDIIVVRFTIIR